MKSRFNRMAVTGAALAVFVAWLLCGSVSTEVGYHCEFTGSSESWTRWPFWIRTDHSYHVSPLEQFLEENFSGQLEHDWVFIGSTGKNVFGEPTLIACGRPNVLLTFPSSYLKLFIEQSSTDEVLALYEILRRGNREEIRVRVDDLYDETNRMMRNLVDSRVQ